MFCASSIFCTGIFVRVRDRRKSTGRAEINKFSKSVNAKSARDNLRDKMTFHDICDNVRDASARDNLRDKVTFHDICDNVRDTRNRTFFATSLFSCGSGRVPECRSSVERLHEPV